MISRYFVLLKEKMYQEFYAAFKQGALPISTCLFVEIIVRCKAFWIKLFQNFSADSSYMLK